MHRAFTDFILGYGGLKAFEVEGVRSNHQLDNKLPGVKWDLNMAGQACLLNKSLLNNILWETNNWKIYLAQVDFILDYHNSCVNLKYILSEYHNSRL